MRDYLFQCDYLFPRRYLFQTDNLIQTDIMNQTDLNQDNKKVVLVALRNGFVVRVPEEEVPSLLASDHENSD